MPKAREKAQCKFTKFSLMLGFTRNFWQYVCSTKHRCTSEGGNANKRQYHISEMRRKRTWIRTTSPYALSNMKVFFFFELYPSTSKIWSVAPTSWSVPSFIKLRHQYDTNMLTLKLACPLKLRPLRTWHVVWMNAWNFKLITIESHEKRFLRMTRETCEGL